MRQGRSTITATPNQNRPTGSDQASAEPLAPLPQSKRAGTVQNGNDEDWRDDPRIDRPIKLGMEVPRHERLPARHGGARAAKLSACAWVHQDCRRNLQNERERNRQSRIGAKACRQTTPVRETAGRLTHCSRKRTSAQRSAAAANAPINGPGYTTVAIRRRAGSAPIAC